AQRVHRGQVVLPDGEGTLVGQLFQPLPAADTEVVAALGADLGVLLQLFSVQDRLAAVTLEPEAVGRLLGRHGTGLLAALPGRGVDGGIPGPAPEQILQHGSRLLPGCWSRRLRRAYAPPITWLRISWASSTSASGTRICTLAERSEERRVGKECRSRLWPYLCRVHASRTE